jgi:Transposase, Mutator family
MFRLWVCSSLKISDVLLTKLSSGISSPKTAERFVHQYLDYPPRPTPSTEPREIYLKIDSTYFGRWGCCLVYKTGKEIIFWDFDLRENYLRYLQNLIKLTEFGYVIKGVTSDKHRGLLEAVKGLFPNIPHQHCIVHLRRHTETLLTKHPETEAGRDLLVIVSLLTEIRDTYHRDIWIKWLERFGIRYQSFINQRSYANDGTRHWWYTHKNLRKAYRSLVHSLDHMFLYLDHPGLESNTNGLETEFSHLKEKLGRHRGLKRHRKISFVRWYWYFKTNKKTQEKR